MDLIPMFLKELKLEAETTRKMLQRVPDEHLDWQPHRKSMTLKQLATHVAEIPIWITLALTTDELDFATTPYNPVDIKDYNHLLDYFEESLADGRAHLAKANEKDLEDLWSMRNGDVIYFTDPKHEVIRMIFCQIVHHRAQLGVYLRLLNIPIPGSYGPSADEIEAMQASEA